MMISEAEAENIDARLVQVRQKQKELQDRIALLQTEMGELEEEKQVLGMIRAEVDPPEKLYQPHNPDNIPQSMVGNGYRLLTRLEMIRHKLDAKTAFPLLEVCTWAKMIRHKLDAKTAFPLLEVCTWAKTSPITLRSDVTYRVPYDDALPHNPENLPEAAIGDGYRMLSRHEFEQARRNWDKTLPNLEFATRCGKGAYTWWRCAEQGNSVSLMPLPPSWTYRIPIEHEPTC